jgi:anaphase-promoting complex subunit 8
MALMFYLHCSQENYQTGEETRRQLSALEDIFPTSSFLKTQRALLLYHSKGRANRLPPNVPCTYTQTALSDFDEAAQIFTSLLHQDPYRLDALDHYSNILYVMSARPQLAFLAQLATAVDKFRPETCCVVGNYYALKSEHEKACMYFRRALTLDRNFLSAWTLMGHEYIEMKNTHAAIESYRRAVDVNRKDYRAWYGLGQAYEVLEMSFYALFYYQKAASLRPFDPKMWQAVGSCYAKMGRPIQSIKALKRALVAGSYFETTSSGPSATTSFGSTVSKQEAAAASGTTRRVMDPETLHQIATMYERIGDLEECAAYMELVIAQETGISPDDVSDDGSDGSPEGGARLSGGSANATVATGDVGRTGGVGVTQTTSKARLWLAKWAFGQGNDLGLKRAYVLAEELCQDGMEVEEAKGIMRDVRGRRDGGVV